MRTPQKRVPNSFERLTVFQHHRLQRAVDERKAGVGLTQLKAENASNAFDGMSGVDIDGVSVDGDGTQHHVLPGNLDTGVEEIGH